MIRYFVLWEDATGSHWTGPFESFEETAELEVRKDPAYRAFVTMTENYHP